MHRTYEGRSVLAVFQAINMILQVTVLLAAAPAPC